jgi:hypothetical protein
MKNTAILFFCAFVTLQCSPPKPVELKDMPMQYASTFQLTTPERIIIEDFVKLSDSIPAKKVEIQDPMAIKKIVALLFQLPDKGEIMIKMGDVPLKRLNFVFTDRIEVVEFYNGRIKTPATSFYAQPNPMEDMIFELISRDSVN